MAPRSIRSMRKAVGSQAQVGLAGERCGDRKRHFRASGCPNLIARALILGPLVCGKQLYEGLVAPTLIVAASSVDGGH